MSATQKSKNKLEQFERWLIDQEGLIEIDVDTIKTIIILSEERGFHKNKIFTLKKKPKNES